MQSSVNKILAVFFMAVILAFGFTFSHAAPPKKIYTEDEFLSAFSGKSKKVFTDKLGKPFKTGISVKPSGASNVMMSAGADEKKSKPVKVEMWYYKNIVTYDNKRTYKETEITFVNDRAMNIAFFNNR